MKVRRNLTILVTFTLMIHLALAQSEEVYFSLGASRSEITVADPFVDDNLVFYEPFNGLSSIEDNNGTISGTVSFFNINGNPVINMTLDSRVTYPLRDNFGERDVTIEFWVKSDGMNTPGFFDVGRQFGTNPNSMGIYYDLGNPIVEVRNAQTLMTQAFCPSGFEDPLEWYNIAARIQYVDENSFDLTCFINGNPGYSARGKDFYPDMNEDFWVGQHYNYGYANSFLDEFKIFNEARTDAQIYQDYLFGKDIFSGLGYLPYAVVRGNNDKIYYNSYNGTSWMGWSSVPGATNDSPAAAVCGGELHLAVRNVKEQIFYGSVTLSNQTFNGWTMIPGKTPSAPDLAVDSTCSVYLAVRGSINQIFLNVLSNGNGTWSGWGQIPGATVDSPAIVVTGSTLHVSVRGAGDKIWYSQVNLTDYSWMGWQPVPGATPSRPDLTAVSQMEVYLAVQGYDNRSYVNRWNGSSWQGWIRPPTGGSPDAPSITVADSSLYLMVRDWGGKIWVCDLNLSTEIWSGWVRVPGATPSPPTITS